MKTLTIAVTSTTTNIDVLNFHQAETIEIDWSWNAAPDGTAITSITLEARYDKDDAAASGPISQTGTVVLDGSAGTVSATFVVDLSVLGTGRTYADVITISDIDGNTKTWTGFVRVLP